MEGLSLLELISRCMDTIVVCYKYIIRYRKTNPIIILPQLEERKVRKSHHKKQFKQLTYHKAVICNVQLEAGRDPPR